MKALIKSIPQSAKAFKALGESNRLRILKMLEIRPLCVCEITEVLQLATSTVSKHLSILRDAGFIIDQKEGKWVDYYSNDSADQPEIRQLLTHLSRWLTDDATIQEDARKVKEVDRYEICNV
ncbi:MAG: winged helix-turn-helix transcriptional regulator [Candidatus Marinimicrobia bacterium]|nr:winged helix-turn-helix transcriptional regulator [Candidatus Neomarinimicrobiota bacterium]